MAYTLPDDIDARPIAIIGAGTLGRRIAAMYAAGGSEVRIVDPAEDQRASARDFVRANAEDIRSRLRLEADHVGAVETVSDLVEAVPGAWMVIEAVPERLDLKREVFGQLDRLADPDAVIGSNSSSLPSSSFIEHVDHAERVLNTHYQMPPDLNAVELMSDGRTDPGVIDGLMSRLPRYGFVPFHVRRESDGFIFNRIWASIKRECLMVVDEGVARPEDVDRMWRLFTAAGQTPFQLMDRVGLDVVLDIKEHYAAVRPGVPEGPRRLLRRYVESGRLGVKTGRGFYEAG